MIDSFQGEYRWLSNFWEEPVTLKGRVFPTAEHAYQACKSSQVGYHAAILAAETPGHAKAIGRSVALRPGWDDMKVRVMTAVIQAKFAPTTPLSWKLMQTGSQEIVEGNTWGDTFWGCVKEPHDKGTWVGANHLGLILMEQRRALQHDIPFGPILSSTAGATTPVVQP